MQSQNISLLPLNDFNFTELNVTELNRGLAQPAAYISHNNMNAGVKTGNIRLTHHGIPRLTNGQSLNIYPDDAHREFIFIPLDLNQPNCVELKNHLNKADAFFGSEDLRKILFGSRWDNYQYQPIIRTKNQGNVVKPDCCKIKFNFTRRGSDRINITKIYKDGKLLFDTKTVTDITQYVRFMSMINFTFIYQKIWANKARAQGANKIMYGVGLKMLEINTSSSLYTYVDRALPFYEMDKLKKSYKQYMDSRKNMYKKNIIIDV